MSTAAEKHYTLEEYFELERTSLLNADVVVSLPSDASSTSPVMIAEVLSNATESYDRGKKFQHYQSIPSFQEYVLVAQDRPHIDHFIREPDSAWRLKMIDGIESTLNLSSVDCRLAFRAIFEGVAFPPEAEPAAEL